MMDLAAAVPELVVRHPRVRAVRLTGSRAAGRAHDFSDWDFLVETEDFAPVAQALAELVAPLGPLAEQWDPYASHACYMLMLRGPVKVDLIFPDERREWSPPWQPSAETLVAIDRHFWDWIMWLEQKRSGGHKDVLATSLGHMYELMLRPMGADSQPEFIAEAVDVYLDLRDKLERSFGVSVPRELEDEVRPAVLSRESPRG
jgi:nucleotidyltransferase-like protein